MAKKAKKTGSKKQGGAETSENIPILTDEDKLGSAGQTGTTTSAGQSGTTTSADPTPATTSENIPDLSTGDKPPRGGKSKKK